MLIGSLQAATARLETEVVERKLVAAVGPTSMAAHDCALALSREAAAMKQVLTDDCGACQQTRRQKMCGT